MSGVRRGINIAKGLSERYPRCMEVGVEMRVGMDIKVRVKVEASWSQTEVSEMSFPIHL